MYAKHDAGPNLDLRSQLRVLPNQVVTHRVLYPYL